MKDYINSRDQRIIKIIDDVRTLTPISNPQQYVRYINSRAYSCYSLAGLVIMESDLPVEAHVYQQASPHVWIESPTSSNVYKISHTQEITSKYISASFKYPIKVETWTLYYLDTAHLWRVTYIWKYSDDGETWTSVGPEQKIKSEVNIWCGNNAAITFTNYKAPEEAHHYWRLEFKQSHTLSKYMYMNYLQMRLKYIPKDE